MASIPRWKIALDNALSKYEKSVVIQLATIADTPSSSSSSLSTSTSPSNFTSTTTTSPTPQVRSLIYRTSLTPKSTPSLPLLISTTDIRTPKVTQIHGNPNIQLVWWIEGTKEQFRISGPAHLVPSPKYLLSDKSSSSSSEEAGIPRIPPIDSSSHITSTYKEPFRYINPISLLSPTTTTTTNSKYDWEHLRIQTFKSLSPYMKATFCRSPSPGSPFPPNSNPIEESKKWPVKIEEPTEDIVPEGDTPKEERDTPEGDTSKEEEKKREREREKEKAMWNMAMRNFALVVVDPVVVDYVELGVLPNRRTVFRRDEEGGWSEEAVVP